MIRTKTRAIRHKQFWRQRTRVPSLRTTKNGEENRNRYARSPFHHLMIPPSAKASRDHSSFIQIFPPPRLSVWPARARTARISSPRSFAVNFLYGKRVFSRPCAP
jgi:hypothetical protein